jgi:phenylalanyl-tRNA synthetase beta chain
MKFTLSWLFDHLETNATLEEIAATLTRIGLEVEDIEDPGKALQPFTVAHILEAAPHPQASKLQVCRVDNGREVLQIVCGAANARAGLKVVLASEGTQIPANGMIIKRSAIRGVESQGMLCSEEELGLAESSEGILELAADAPVGEKIVTLLGLNDPVIEINLTPNRADCLGVRGIARDLAATGIGTLKPLPERKPVMENNISPFPVDIRTPACHGFIGYVIRGVKNGPSPAWMQNRLKAIGQRPISLLVDVTNYLMFDLARPLHVYDLSTLEKGIIVREATEGETLLALNGKEYSLSAGMTVIADHAKALGLGGIIGGEASGCTDSTTDILLECALFDAVDITHTGRALNLITDARYRFERHVDAGFVQAGAAYAAALIQELCGGKASSPTLAGKVSADARSIIRFDPTRVSTLGGLEVPAHETTALLKRLGCEVQQADGGTLSVTPPSWRADIRESADLVEEVLRIHGYDAIPNRSLDGSADFARPVFSPLTKRAFLCRRLLAARAMQEIVSWSFLHSEKAKHFGTLQEGLFLENPISAELDYMRPSLLPHLLDALVKNQARGVENLSLFEVGPQFLKPEPGAEQQIVAGIRAGQALTRNPHLPARSFDVFDAKADILHLLQQLGMDTGKLQTLRQAPGYYHPGRSAALCLGPKNVLGYFGELHPALLQSFEVKGRVMAFELVLDNVPLPRNKGGKSKPALQLSDYQSVERDFALLVDACLAAGELKQAVAGVEKQLIRRVDIFDIYAGANIESGKKSVALSVTLQADDRTLSEQEITTVSQAIVKKLADSFGAQLR